MLRELGVPFAGRRPDVRGLALRDGQLRVLPVDVLSLLRTRLLGGKAKQELAGLLSGVGRLDTRNLEGVSLGDWLARVLPGSCASP